MADPGPVERGLSPILSVRMVVGVAMTGPCLGSVRGGVARFRDEIAHSGTTA